MKRPPLVTFNGDSKTVMIVSKATTLDFIRLTFSGEILEKTTRVLTHEEKVLLDQEWVGRDGTKRKLEVVPHYCYLSFSGAKPNVDGHGSPKIEKVVPVRSQMAWSGP